MNLRPYQIEADKAMNEVFLSHQSALLILPTGCGKTVSGAHWLKRRLSIGRAIWMQHRNELLRQAKGTIERVTGESVDVEKAEERAQTGTWWEAPSVVTTYQTMISGRNGSRRFQRFNPNQFASFVTDEAHHAITSSYRMVVQPFLANPNLRHLGLTATPNRADEAALGQVFEIVAYEYSMQDAINDGWLVPITQKRIHMDEIDLSVIHTLMGDLNARELEQLMTDPAQKILRGMAAEILKWTTAGEKTLIFTVGTDDTKELTHIINSPGYKPGSAAYITGKTPPDERRDILRRYRAGTLQYLLNCQVFTEGFDEPGIEVLVPRLTKNLPFYQQMLGRGTRPLTGIVDGLDNADDRKAAIRDSRKASLLVLDFAGNSGRHKIVDCIDALGGEYSDEVLELARTRQGDARDPDDVREAIERAKEEVAERYAERKAREEDEAKRRHGIIARVTATYEDDISPFTGDPSGVYHIPPWRARMRPTAKQVAALARFGFEDVSELNRGQASALLTECYAKKPPTPKMIGFLKWKGCWRPGLSFSEAGKLIGAIKSGKPIPRRAEWAKGPVG